MAAQPSEVLLCRMTRQFAVQLMSVQSADHLWATNLVNWIASDFMFAEAFTSFLFDGLIVVVRDGSVRSIRSMFRLLPPPEENPTYSRREHGQWHDNANGDFSSKGQGVCV